MTFRLGLTGSIGMGKSTTAALFAEAGVPVWDADTAVHRLYSEGGAAVQPLGQLWPAAVTEGSIAREELRRWIARDASALKRIEAVVHPLVAEDRARFLAATESDIAVLDVPLLYETGGEAQMDAVAVVSAPPDIQRARVLARPGLTEPDFEAMLARQMPDAEKRARADYVIETTSLDAARRAVHNILKNIRGQSDA